MADLLWNSDDFRNPKDSSGTVADTISHNGELQQGYFHGSLTQGLVAYYPMEAGTESTLYDSTELGNNGSINGASWTSGKTGSYCLSFDGDDFVEVSYPGPDLENWTISAWLLKDDWSGSGLQDWASAQESDTTNSNKPLDFYWDSGKITHRRGDAAGEVLAADVSSRNGWIHAAVTQRRISSSSVELMLFIDGVQKDAVSGDYENMRPKNALNLGRAFTDEQYYIGRIDDFRLYERRLSNPEIKALYNLSKPSTVKPEDTLH